MKEKYKKIILLLAIILLSCTMLTSINAAVTTGTGTPGLDQGAIQNAADFIGDVMAVFSETAMSGVFATITTTINLLTIALTALLWVFMGTASTNIHLPFPDVLVFNRNAFFDANFINPAHESLLEKFGSIPKNMFASFQTIAISLFVIAAMITGIKMALSTVATKKAQYKESALKWLTGFIILLCLKWIIAGLFYMNEYIIEMLYKASIVRSVKINLYVTDAIPIFGQVLTELIKKAEEALGATDALHTRSRRVYRYIFIQLIAGSGWKHYIIDCRVYTYRSNINNNYFIFKESIYGIVIWNNCTISSSN